MRKSSIPSAMATTACAVFGNQDGTRYDNARVVTAYTPALDGLRGLAIILVLFHHFTVLEPVTEIDRALITLPLIGWCGVDLFFVLSGFLITGILIDARGSDRYFFSFYARRTLRIFPLYYMIAFLSLIVLPQFAAADELLAGQNPPRAQAPYWLYLTNFAVAEQGAFSHGILDVAWSLAIEEQFYLVWAVLVWICPPRWLGPLCAALIVLPVMARALAVERGVEPIDAYVLTYYRADALATGALVAWLLRAGWLERVGRAGLPVAVCGVAAVIAICLLEGDSWWWQPRMQQAGYALLIVTAVGMLVAAVVQPSDRWWPRLLSAGWLCAFGKYSYCLYLIHLPVMRVVRAFVLAPAEFSMFGSVWIGQLIFYAAATAVAFGLAWLSWRYFEAPILRLKARFPY
jgi:peptidoglycan/LPS O-acetylase OafA/YrhL